MVLETIFDDLYDLSRSIDRMFGTYQPKKFRTVRWPETNIYENHDDYIVVSKLPGVEKGNINISFKDNALKISGEKTASEKDSKDLYINERFTGKFERNFLINEKVDADKISAEMNNGLLIIKLPKAPETKPKNISIN